ncbi:hypothetical protein HND97_15975 [Vibrio cholerae]|nr:hypothetical protein HND97_15975 [Vibrio cholerae]
MKSRIFLKISASQRALSQLTFAPEYKVPLYQVVFHDELVSSHHWHSDSLKFSNVKAVRDLRAMLFNTLAIVHLSCDEARKTRRVPSSSSTINKGFALA